MAAAPLFSLYFALSPQQEQVVTASEAFPAWLAGRRYYVGFRTSPEAALARARLFDSTTATNDFGYMVDCFSSWEQLAQAFTDTVEIGGWTLPLLHRKLPSRSHGQDSIAVYHWNGDLPTASTRYSVEFRSLQLE